MSRVVPQWTDPRTPEATPFQRTMVLVAIMSPFVLMAVGGLGYIWWLKVGAWGGRDTLGGKGRANTAIGQRLVPCKKLNCRGQRGNVHRKRTGMGTGFRSQAQTPYVHVEPWEDIRCLGPRAMAGSGVTAGSASLYVCTGSSLPH